MVSGYVASSREDETAGGPGPAKENHAKEDTVLRLVKGTCQYLKGGVCTVHGGGANKKWKPAGKERIVGEDRTVMWKTRRTVYYMCEEKGGLIQARLTLNDRGDVAVERSIWDVQTVQWGKRED